MFVERGAHTFPGFGQGWHSPSHTKMSKNVRLPNQYSCHDLNNNPVAGHLPTFWAAGTKFKIGGPFDKPTS